MPEVSFLLRIVVQFLYLVVDAFLLRFLLQTVRADFRNPIAQFIVRFTNPLVLPLRKLLPPIGRTDTASVVAVILVDLLVTAAAYVLGGGGLPSLGSLIASSILHLAAAILSLYQIAIFAWVLLSWINPGTYNPLGRLLGQLVEPVLAPFRRALPSLGGLDVSPIVVILLIQFLQVVLGARIEPLLRNLVG